MTAIAAAIALIFALATPIAAPAGPPADCRCAQLTLDRYYADASIVVVARVTSVRPVERDDNSAATAGADSTASAPVASPTAGADSTASASVVFPDRGSIAGYIAIDIQPLFRQGRAFKGSLDGVTFVTSDNSASCGVPVEAGATYIIFGAPDPADPTVAYFDTCSGSRQYPDAQHRAVALDFLGTPDNRVVPQLFELAEGDTAQSQAPAPEYHTSPACWIRPRITHECSPSAALRDRIRLTTQSATVADSGGIVSPNNAYTAYTSMLPAAASDEGGAVVWIDVEQARINEQPREVPIDVLEVRTIDGFHWLHIAIYAESTCVNADATPLHAGWVPAFSMTGRFVLGTWPGGCSP